MKCRLQLELFQRNRRQMNLTERPPIPSEPSEPKGKDATEVYPTQEEYTPVTPPEVTEAAPDVSDVETAHTLLRSGRVSRPPQRFGFET